MSSSMSPGGTAAVPLGQTALSFAPVEFLDRLPALVPRPRRHRHRYHGGLAPHAPLRAALTACGGLPMAGPVHDAPLPAATEGRDAPAAQARPPCRLSLDQAARTHLWNPSALLPRCSAPMRIIAFITEVGSIHRSNTSVRPPAPRASPPSPEVRPTGRGTSIHAKAKRSL
jgi:hypothetical protein